MNILDLIDKKKHSVKLAKSELEYLIKEYLSGEITDYQMSAFLMAVYFTGMDIEETTILTDLTVKSGEVLDFSDISSDVVDKHSTGGVGDKITLILLPILTAAGVTTAKLSGRGLGNTGGTIDKLESIPGFKTNLNINEFKNLIKKNGVAIGAQTANLTPADGKMYALRDVTGTIDIIPLIACSVVAKKIASGANHIILDVKCGDGAFMQDIEAATELAETMSEVGKRLGRNVSCLITNMNMPLGRAVGNALEVIEVIEFLKGNYPCDLAELTFEQAAIAFVKTKKVVDYVQGRKLARELVASGKALEKFREIIEAQGGNSKVIDDYSLFPQVRKKIEIKSKLSGYISNISATKTAKACKLLGAGRVKKGDAIDYATGVYLNKKDGEKVEIGDVLATLYVNDEKKLKDAESIAFQAFDIKEQKTPEKQMIYDKINV